MYAPINPLAVALVFPAAHSWRAASPVLVLFSVASIGERPRPQLDTTCQGFLDAILLVPEVAWVAVVFVSVTTSCRCQCVRPTKNLILSHALLLTDILHRCAALTCSSVGRACNSLNRGCPPTSAVKVCACGTRQPRRFSLHHASVCSSWSTPFVMRGSFSCGRVHVTMLSQCFLVVFPEFFNISIPHTQHVRIPTPHKIIPRWQVFERCHCEAFRARPCDEWKAVFRSRPEA